MRTATPLRRQPVLWLLIPAIPLLILVARESGTDQPLSGFWTWTVARSVLLVIVPAAVAATAAALSAARLRQRRDENSGNVRSAPAVLFDALWPALVGAVLVQIVAIATIALDAWGGSSAVPWTLLLALVAILFFHMSAGFLLGSLLRPVIAIPISLAFSYSWLGFTGTTDWFPLRHLAGLVLETCCMYQHAPSPSSIAAVSLFSAAVGFALLLVSASVLRLGAPAPRVTATIAVALLLAGSAGGLAFAWNLRSDAVAARSADDLVCSDGDPTVCLFPEQLAESPETGSSPPERIRALLGPLSTLGVQVPDRVVAGDAQADPDALPLQYLPWMTTPQLAGSLASSFVVGEPLDCSESVARTVARQRVESVLPELLTTTMLQEDTAVNDAGSLRTDEESAAAARRISGLPDTDRQRWVRAAFASMRDCRADPPAVPR